MAAGGLRTGTIGALAGLQLTGEDIGPLEIEATDLAEATITYTKLVSGAATGYLTPKYLQKDCVTCSQIANNAILDVNVAAGTLSPRKLSSGAVTGLLTGKYIALGSVTPRALASGAATGLLTGKYIALGSVTPKSLTSGAATGVLSGKYMALGSVSPRTLTSGAVTGLLTQKYVANATLSPRTLTSGAATGLLTGKYIALGSVTPRSLSSGAATGLLTGKYIALGSVTPLTLTSGAATGLLTAKYIQSATVKNANLSSPESYFTMHTRIFKRACNQAAASVAFMGELPVAASLVSVHAAASTINNVSIATPGCCVWVTNGTNRLLSGSGVIVSSTAFLARSGAVQSAAQAAGTKILVSAKTSTTLSALGVDVVSVWKAPHST